MPITHAILASSLLWLQQERIHPMADQEYSALIDRARALLTSIAGSPGFPTFLNRTPLTETYLSNQLAWLLDTTGTHNFGPRFANAFLKSLAKIRTQGHPAENHQYHHRQQYLRSGRQPIRGTLASGFSLRNAAVFREFYLAHKTASAVSRNTMLCDLVLLDLDPHDGLFLAIENKLFTTNHEGQLERYREIIETRYHRAKVLEYAYLTLLGEKPRLRDTTASRACQRVWVRMSWIHDILPILESLTAKNSVPEDLQPLMSVLHWFRSVTEHQAEATAVVTELLETMATVAADGLLDELTRLNDDTHGHWIVRRRSKQRTRIQHSSKPAAALLVGVQSNLSVVLQSRQRSRGKFDKLLIPFGSNADQIFNLMDMVARDVYALHFGARAGRHLTGTRRLTAQTREVREQARPFFQFIHDHRHELQMLAPMVRVQARHVLHEEGEG